MTPKSKIKGLQLLNIHEQTPLLKNSFRLLAILAISLLCVLIFTLITSRTDFISYWSTGKLLLHQADPYSAAGVSALEKAEGYSDLRPLIMRNPPWALFLIFPFGLGSVRIGLFLWTLATVACVFISVQLLEIPSKERAYAYVFAPAVASVFMGQSSAFLLLGFSLFLRFHQSRPFLAGASLLLMAIKPHLFLAFWVLLLVDVLYRRKFLLFAGGASALAVASAISICFDPHVWQHYLAMLRTSSLENEPFPTLSNLFRIFVDVRAFWLIFVPSTLAIFWGLWYYARRRRVWDWRIHGMLLLLVCILSSPYAWFTDEAVLLPSILFALGSKNKPKHSAWILLAINSAALWIVLAHQAAMESHAYLWTPVTWLAWFLYATHGFKYPGVDPGAPLKAPQLATETAVPTILP